MVQEQVAYTFFSRFRHGETIVHSQQPLLRAKPLRTVHNLLAMRATGDSGLALVFAPPTQCYARLECPGTKHAVV